LFLKLENYSETLRILVARHGLEWWAAWPLHTKIAQDKAVNRECFQNILSKYPKLIILK